MTQGAMVTGYPRQPTSTSDRQTDPAEVMGQPVPDRTEPDAPAETPARSAPDQKAAPGTSETMTPVEGIYRPEEHDDTPE
jgi:hypothetical protein